MSDGKILFARDVTLVLPSMSPIDVAALALAPTFFLGRIPVLVPPATPTSTLIPTAYSAMFGTVGSVKLFQRVGWNTSMKHSIIPDLLRPLRRLQSRGIDKSRSASPLVCDLPGVGDGRVAAWRWAGVRSHCWGEGGLVRWEYYPPSTRGLNIEGSVGKSGQCPRRAPHVPDTI